MSVGSNERDPIILSRHSLSQILFFCREDFSLILYASDNLERGTWFYWQFEDFVGGCHCQAFPS